MLFVPPSIPFMVPEAEADHVSYTALNFISPSDWATSCEANNNDCRMSPIDQADSIVFDIHYKPRVPIPFPIESFDIWIDSDNFSSRWVHENWEYQEHTADPTVPLDYSNPTCVSGNTQFGFRGTTPYWSPSTSDPYEISSCGGISVQMINHDVYRFTISGLTDGEHEVIVKSNKLNTWGPATTSFMLKVGDDDTTPPIFTLHGKWHLIYDDPSDNITRQATNSTGYNVNFNVGANDDIDGSVGSHFACTNWCTTDDDSDTARSTGTVSCSSESNSLFPVGVTTVTCTATDAAGNTGTLSFTVTVLAPAIPDAPYTITGDGGDCQYIGTWDAGSKTCTLTTGFSSTGHGIIVNNNGIKIDGAGFVITGDGSGNQSSFGVDVTEKDNFIIENLGIQGFDIGIRTDSSNEGTITGNTLTSNVQDGIKSFKDAELQITNNVITNNGRIGINIYAGTGTGMCGGGSAFLVQQNTVSSNTDSGIDVASSSGICFDQNTVNSNGNHGIFFTSSPYGIFTNNIVNNNMNKGYYSGNTPPETFTGNSASQNGGGGSNNFYGLDCQVPFENNCVLGGETADTTPPVLTLDYGWGNSSAEPGDTSENIKRLATNSTGYNASFAVVANDAGDGWSNNSSPVSCSSASNDLFPVGVTTVTCTATDAAGNTGTLSFTVTVILEGAADTTPPILTLKCCWHPIYDDPSDNITRQSTNSTGFNVIFTVSANDGVDGYVGGYSWHYPEVHAPVSCSWNAFDLFPVGVTTVTCTATDAAGNTGTLSFTVTVLEPPAPATDTILTDKESYTHNETIIVTGQCSPDMGCRLQLINPDGDAATWSAFSDYDDPAFSNYVYEISLLDLYNDDFITETGYYTLNLIMAYSMSNILVSKTIPINLVLEDEDTTFPAETPAIILSNYQLMSCYAGNSEDCYERAHEFTGNIPKIWVTFNEVVPTMGNLVNIVAVFPNAQSGVSKTSVNVPYTLSYPGGIEEGTLTHINTSNLYDMVLSIDNAPIAGHYVFQTELISTSFDVYAPGTTSSDTTPPVVNVPANITDSTSNSAGKTVTFTVTASDDVDVISSPTCSPSSGSNFPIGTTTVICTAGDASGNSSTASFTVTVVLEGAEEEIVIPSWIKSNAGWWDAGLIDDRNYVTGLQWLITNGVMTIPSTEQGTGSDDVIPSWVKNNARWWADGSIDDRNYVTGLQWLITNGVMTIG